MVKVIDSCGFRNKLEENRKKQLNLVNLPGEDAYRNKDKIETLRGEEDELKKSLQCMNLEILKTKGQKDILAK